LQGSKGATGGGGDSGPEVFKPTGKQEGALDELKNLGIDKGDVPEWMKPSNDLLEKVNQDKEVMSPSAPPHTPKIN
jgi:hypothetical protein